MLITMTIFIGLLKALSISTAVKGTNILLFVDSCAIYLQHVIPTECRSCVLTTKVNKHDITSCVGHHMIFKAVSQEALGTKKPCT
jgi:hypothetical protein